MVENRSVRAVVLAGGDSRRFGDEDKALAELGGRPLLAHVLDAVGAATDAAPMLAVASDEEGQRLVDAMAVPEGAVTVVTDDPSFEGPLGGLAAAARRAERQWLLVCGCDMPLVTVSAVETLVERASDDVEAVVPVVDGHDQPLLALYDRERVSELAPDLAGRGPRALVESLGHVRRLDVTSVDPPFAEAVTNVNTRNELERLREREHDGR